MNFSIFVLLFLLTGIAQAGFAQNESCINFELSSFDVKDDCQPSQASDMNSQIRELNQIYQDAGSVPVSAGSLENRVRRRLCYAQFGFGETRQFSVNAHSQYPFLPHREYCTKDGLIFECGERTTSASVNCWPHRGRGHGDLKPGCHMTVVVKRDQQPDNPLRCRCSQLGCGQMILRAFPKEVSQQDIENALDGFGCGRTEIIGYAESQRPAQPGEIREFVISSQNCTVSRVAGDCTPGTSPKFMFGSRAFMFSSDENPMGFNQSRFPIVCVPDSVGPEAQGSPEGDET